MPKKKSYDKISVGELMVVSATEAVEIAQGKRKAAWVTRVHVTAARRTTRRTW